MSEFKGELRTTLNESREQMKDMLNNANGAIKETKQESFQTTANTKEEAERIIQYIRENAKDIAISEAKMKVDDAFIDKNIQKVIDETAQKEIESRMLENFKLIPNFILAIDKIRNGDKKVLLYIDSIAKNSTDKYYKTTAKKIVEDKTKEYDDSKQEIFSLSCISIGRKQSLNYSP